MEQRIHVQRRNHREEADRTPGDVNQDDPDEEPAFCGPDIGEICHLLPAVVCPQTAIGHFWFGRPGWKPRSRMLLALPDRSPSSLGLPRRLGRALRALTSISRSIR